MRTKSNPTGPSRLALRSRDLLEQVMGEQGVSANKVAKLSGVDDTTISAILRQELNPSLDIMDRIFAGLGYETSLEITHNTNLTHQPQETT